MSEFIETPRFPDEYQLSSSGGPEFNTSVTEYGVDSPAEFRNSNWPLARRRFNLSKFITAQREAQYEELLDWFYIARGRFRGFRIKDFADFKSSNIATDIDFTDQQLAVANGSTVAFQLIKIRTIGSFTHNATILKPVSGTVRIGVDGNEWPSTEFSVDTTTGIVTLTDRGTPPAINAIVLGNPTTIQLASTSPYVDGDYVFATGIGGTVQLNNQWWRVITSSGSEFTLDVDSTIFTPFTSGGTFRTIPPSGSIITAGFEYDIPVRFDSDSFDGMRFEGPDSLNVDNLELVELFNP